MARSAQQRSLLKRILENTCLSQMHGKNGIAIKRGARKHGWSETSKGRRDRERERERERKWLLAGYYQDRTTDSDLNHACVASTKPHFAPPGHGNSQDGYF